MPKVELTYQDFLNIQLASKVIEKAEKKNPDKIKGLVKWVGKVGFDECVAKVSTVKGIDDAKAVCGAMKHKARERGQLSPQHMGRKEKAKHLKAKKK